jgi:diguanylate cyclase (GGDEF)-like protein
VTPFGFRIVQSYRSPMSESATSEERLRTQVEDQEFELGRLRQAALRDPITDGANMRCLGISWDWLEAGDPVSLLTLDIDGFRHVNDSLGRTMGDALLKSVQTGLERAVRWDDVVAREGGDRFFILLPLAIAEDAMVVAERIQATIEKMCFEVPQGKFKINVRVGCATREGEETLDSVMARADSACRKAKQDSEQIVAAA